VLFAYRYRPDFFFATLVTRFGNIIGIWVQSSLLGRDILKRAFGLGGRLSFAFLNSISIQVMMAQRDFDLSGTVQL
jgi:hypothetical protein